MQQAQDEDGQQRRHEQVGRQGEEQARLADSAQVDEGDEDEKAEAEGQDVIVQLGQGGDERADAGGDADGDVERIVQHQGGGGASRPKRTPRFSLATV